uniref:Mucin-5AC n=1 Tax=Angiostrongylus cantonensis TaxID=6313 RepID=A0A158PCC0_ANGCA
MRMRGWRMNSSRIADDRRGSLNMLDLMCGPQLLAFIGGRHQMEWGCILLIVSVAWAAQEEHFIDVKQLVKGTIEAMSKLPMPQNGTDPMNEKNSEQFYKLFQVPADIMGKLAADAGYLDTTYPTTTGPWIVRRLLSNVKQQLPAVPVMSIQSPAEMASSLANSASLVALPVLQGATGSSQSSIQPQYVYQPIIKPDGKTYYQQLLILPGKVTSNGAEVGLLPSIQRSSFLQEMPVQQKQEYSEGFIKSPSNFVEMAIQDDSPNQVQTKESDSIAKPLRYTSIEPVEQFPRQLHSLLTTKQPLDAEQQTSAPLFHEDAAAPKPLVKVAQTSPLRIRTIQSRLKQASNAETETIRAVKHTEEPRTPVEQNLEIVESQMSHHDRKFRRAKKPRRLLNKRRHFVDDVQTIEPVPREHHESIRRMPQKQYLERVMIQIPYSRQKFERAHASKTSKRARYEPLDTSISKDLVSFGQRKDPESRKNDEKRTVTPAKKRRRNMKGTKSTKTLETKNVEIEFNDEKRIRNPQLNEMDVATPMILTRRTLQMNKLKEETRSTMKNNERKAEHHPEIRSHIRRTKKRIIKNTKEIEDELLQASTSPTNVESPSLRRHCLNIRTFARQFGFDDVKSFAGGMSHSSLFRTSELFKSGVFIAHHPIYESEWDWR